MVCGTRGVLTVTVTILCVGYGNKLNGFYPFQKYPTHLILKKFSSLQKYMHMVKLQINKNTSKENPKVVLYGFGGR